jgi:hypothetical protein
MPVKPAPEQHLLCHIDVDRSKNEAVRDRLSQNRCHCESCIETTPVAIREARQSGADPPYRARNVAAWRAHAGKPDCDAACARGRKIQCWRIVW